MLDVETLDMDVDAAQRALRHLPVYAGPQPDEALVSWLARLAGRYDAPAFRFAQAAVGLRPVDPRRSREAWWERPGPNVIEGIGRMTGTAVEAVRATTFEDWGPPSRHEGTPDRFSARHFRVVRLDGRRMRRFVVCPACLVDDAESYVRKTWTLGWVAVSAHHHTVLLSTCPKCRITLRLPAPSSFEPFAPDICGHCGAPLAGAATRDAHAAAIALQAALLEVKRRGEARLPGLGVLDWPTAMAAADVLLGAIWTNTEPNLRSRFLRRVANDLGLDRIQRGLADNYAGLLILAWLLDAWPDRLHMTMQMLRTSPLRSLINRWDDIDSNMRARLLHAMGHGRAPRPPQPTRWSAWLAGLDAAKLRASARRERYAFRRVRLLAIADVRDGNRIEAVASGIGVQAQTVHRWLQQGAASGLDAALEWKSNSVLNSAQRAELADLIARGRKRCRHSAAWSAREIQEEAKASFDIEISMQAAARLCRAHAPKRRHQTKREIVEQLPRSIGTDSSPVFSGPVHLLPDQSGK
jgi:transposase